MNDSKQAINDRCAGTFLGLAIGDALGAAVEFQPPGSFEPVVDYRGDGPHGLNPGEWTDDTSMALALADSLASVHWNLEDQADRYLDWMNGGKYSVNGVCFDIGHTTSSALMRFEQFRNPRTSGPTDDRLSGNGSIMRLAPIPIYFLNLFPESIERLSVYAAESSLPTHASPKCLSACQYMSLILCGLMSGHDRDAVLAPDWPPLTELQRVAPLDTAIEEVAAGSFRSKSPPEIIGSGYVVQSLEAALWAFHDASDFREAVLRAVNLGYDTDTTGAVCGQFAGAYWGREGIPASLLKDLAKREVIEEAIVRLLAQDGSVRG